MIKISKTIRDASLGLSSLCAKNVDELVSKAESAALAVDYAKAEQHLDSLGFMLGGMQAIDEYCNRGMAFQNHLLVAIRQRVFKKNPCLEFIAKHRDHPVLVLSDDVFGSGNEMLDFHLAKAWLHLPHEFQVRSMAEAMMCFDCAFNEPGPVVEDRGFEDLQWGLPETEPHEQFHDHYADLIEPVPATTKRIAPYRSPRRVQQIYKEAAFFQLPSRG